jgi:hypothetical protein
MAKKTITQVKNWFNILGINAEIKFNGKSIKINDQNFRLPAESKDHDYTKGIKFDEKVITYVKSLFPANIEEIEKQYTKVLEDLRIQNLKIDFTYVNYRTYAPQEIRNNIENAKRLIEYAESQPDFYNILEQYEAYRNLVEYNWHNITE